MVLQKSKEHFSSEPSFGRSLGELFSISIIQAEPFLLVQCLKVSVLVEISGVSVVNIENHVLSFLFV